MALPSRFPLFLALTCPWNKSITLMSSSAGGRPGSTSPCGREVGAFQFPVSPGSSPFHCQWPNLQFEHTQLPTFLSPSLGVLLEFSLLRDPCLQLASVSPAGADTARPRKCPLPSPEHVARDFP